MWYNKVTKGFKKNNFKINGLAFLPPTPLGKLKNKMSNSN